MRQTDETTQVKLTDNQRQRSLCRLSESFTENHPEIRPFSTCSPGECSVWFLTPAWSLQLGASGWVSGTRHAAEHQGNQTIRSDITSSQTDAPSHWGLMPWCQENPERERDTQTETEREREQQKPRARERERERARERESCSRVLVPQSWSSL